MLIINLVSLNHRDDFNARSAKDFRDRLAQHLDFTNEETEPDRPNALLNRA